MQDQNNDNDNKGKQTALTVTGQRLRIRERVPFCQGIACTQMVKTSVCMCRASKLKMASPSEMKWPPGTFALDKIHTVSRVTSPQQTMDCVHVGGL